jgi:hypothetical protein
MSFKDQLEESGLTLSDAKKLKFKDLSSNETDKLIGQRTASLYIPYFDVKGKLIPEMFRVRYYSPERKKSFGPPKLGRPPKPRKYDQPSGVLPRAYFPPTQPWAKIIKDTSVPIFITEGEKKAAKACKEGFPTIGLGGIWNFMSKKLGIQFLKELTDINWSGREVVIAYDSDIESNAQNRKAIHELSKRLITQGATVKKIRFIQYDESKVGLDDFLVAEGPEAFIELLKEAESISSDDRDIEDYLQRYALVVENGGVYDFVKNRLQSQRVFKEGHPDEFVVRLNDKGQPVQVTKATAWIKSQKKTTADSIVVEPYGVTETIPSRITSGGDLNVFRGYGHIPKRGTTRPWRDLLNIVFTYNKEQIPWFEQWLAYPLQNPGAKLNTAIFVYGGQGVGKSALGLLMLDIYGNSGIHIQDSSLFSNFNKWMEGALFVMGDDLAAEHVKKSRSILKDLVGGETVLVEPKGIDAYKVRNLANFYMTANQASALPLDPSGSNRRFLVINAPMSRPVAKSWYTSTFDTWRKQKEGARYVLDRLLKVNLSGFNPYDDAPDTLAKANVVRATEQDVDGWVRDIKHNEGLPHDLYDINSIHAVYKSQTGDERSPKRSLVTSLTQFAEGLGQIYFGKKHGAQRPLSLWAIRNTQKYAGKSKNIIADRYMEQQASYSKIKNGRRKK